VGRSATASPVFLGAFNEFNNELRSLRYVVVPRTAIGAIPDPTDEELKRFYDNQRAKFTQAETRKIGILAVTPETVKDKVEITEGDIKAAYEREKTKLGTPERRKVEQIAFPDQSAAEAAYKKIQAGTDFVALAKEQNLNESDISLGLLSRADMADAAIGDAAFKLEKDKVSGPVTGELGKTVLLRVTEIEPGKDVTFEEAKADVEKKILKERAQVAIFDLHDTIEDERAAGAQLSEIGTKFNIPYRVVEQVDRRGQAPDGTSPDLPQKTELLNAVFATEVGVENDPIDAKDDGLVWYELLDITPERLKPLDQVKQEVIAGWRVEEERNRMAKHTDELVKQLNGGKTLEDVAKELNTEVVVSEPLKRSGMTVNILPNAMMQAFALPQGGYGSAPSGVDEGRIVFQVDKVTPPAPLDEASTNQLKGRLANFMGEDIIGEYFTALEQRYGVHVNQQALSKLTGSDTQ
jgi:peptidyl-prolyl cis-trans isomerase D